MMFIDSPRCPECKEELITNDSFLDDSDGDTIWFASRGYCPKCKKNFEWYEEFTLRGISTISPAED